MDTNVMQRCLTAIPEWRQFRVIINHCIFWRSEVEWRKVALTLG